MQPRDLGDLADATKFHAPLVIDGEPRERLVSHLRLMMLIRQAEQCLAGHRKDGLIGGPVHLGVGQEAIAVGVSAHLRRTDMVFGAHRSHAHLLALGSSIHGLFAEVLGKKTGLSRGMGGSMHLWDGSVGFHGSVPIVAGTVPLAVGAGLAAKLKKTDDLGVVYFGDGATEEGGVHESLNLASVLKAPVLFVAENNLFSSHMDIKLRQPSNTTARFADAHGVAYEVVDGNDVVAVDRAAARLIARARSGQGPAFLEAVTYRWYGHVDWREDIDVGVNRSKEFLAQWLARDPVLRLKSAMITAGMWTDAESTALFESLQREMQDTWDRAMADPYPDAEALMDCVYAKGDAPR